MLTFFNLLVFCCLCYILYIFFLLEEIARYTWFALGFGCLLVVEDARGEFS